MRFDVVTLFPAMFVGPFEDGVLARARKSGRIEIRIHDLRRFGEGRHRQVDDVPFGGGGGMVLKPGPIVEAVEWIRRTASAERDRVVLLSPQGRRFDRAAAQEMAGDDRVVLVCGRYEGVDERVRDLVVDEEVSVGDFVLTGGELPAMMVIDAVSRWVPGVLGDDEAAARDSFSGDRLDHPQYTRPRSYRGLEVPDVLTSGDHAAIERWRHERSLEATREKRPDLLDADGGEAPRGRG